jgi:hypothetical protein
MDQLSHRGRRRFRRSCPFVARLALVAGLAAGPARAGGDAVASLYAPDWGDVTPLRVLKHDYDPTLTNIQNGASLAGAIDALVPGDRLEVGTGIYSIDKKFIVSLIGWPTAPIWIVAQDGALPIITRPDLSQNLMNVGELVKGPAQYLCFRGFVFVGGSLGVRFHDVNNIWFDENEIMYTSGAGLTANIPGLDTHHLYITRNEIHDTHGTGEGMYLGGNYGNPIVSESIIALNNVYKCGGTQGDGIELKQGSWGNWISQNTIHDCKGPCLLVYGTYGKPSNKIERNILYRSNDNVLQVQGEADVLGNLVVYGINAFQSHDHQDKTRDLRFENNTVINVGRAMNLTSWNDRPGMFLANNVIYSQLDVAVRFTNGSQGVTISKNIVLGDVVHGPPPDIDKFAQGNGLQDFVGLDWNGTALNARPAPGSPLIEHGSPEFPALHGYDRDLNGQILDPKPEAGCYELDSYGYHYGWGVEYGSGALPYISVNGPPEVDAPTFAIQLKGAPPSSPAVIAFGSTPAELPLLGGHLWLVPDQSFFLWTDASGTSSFPVGIPDDPKFAGAEVYLQWAVATSLASSGVVFTEGLYLTIGP